MKKKLLIALTSTLALAICTNLQSMTKARTLMQVAATYARNNKLKTTGIVVGVWLLADIGGHAVYHKIAKKFKAMELNTAKRGVTQAENALAYAQGQAKMSAELAAQNDDASLLAQFDANAAAHAPAKVTAAKSKRDALQKEYDTMQPKQSFTERLVRTIATKIF